jgi:hypothetical protein
MNGAILPVPQYFYMTWCLIKHWTTLKVKLKVKLFLCLTKHHAIKTYWVSGGIAFSDLGTRWSIGGGVGSRAGLNVVSKRKIPSPRRESNPDRPALSQSIPTEISLLILDIFTM